MSRNDASIEIDGPNAKPFAQTFLNSLDVDPEDIIKIHVEIVTTASNETLTEFSSDGPSAGHIALSMLNSVDWDDHPPTRLTVDLKTRDGGADDDEDDPDEAAELDDTEAEDPPRPPDDDRSVDVDMVDDVTSEELQPNSPQHMAITAVAAFYTKVTASYGESGTDTGESDGTYDDNVRGVSARQLLRTIDVPLNYGELATALEEAFVEYGVLEQNKGINEDGRTVMKYYLNDLGRAFLAENGAHRDISEDITNALESASLPDGNPYQKLREAIAGVSRNVTSRDHRGRHIDEPRVDEPQPVTADTRKHEMLCALAQWHMDHSRNEEVTASDMYEYAEFDFPSSEGASALLSQLFLDHALTNRRKSDQSGRKAVYKLNEDGWEEIKRLGEPTQASNGLDMKNADDSLPLPQNDAKS